MGLYTPVRLLSRSGNSGMVCVGYEDDDDHHHIKWSNAILFSEIYVPIAYHGRLVGLHEQTALL